MTDKTDYYPDVTPPDTTRNPCPNRAFVAEARRWSYDDPRLDQSFPSTVDTPTTPISEPHSVTSPSHYVSGGIECIDAIRASLTPAEFQGYCKGNVLKYNWRHRLKNGLEDVKKAQVYQGWLVASLEENE